MALEYLVKQGYSIVNDAVADILGLDNGEIDTSDIATLGKKIEEMNLYDGFYGALTNRIAKTITYVFNHTANPRNVLTDGISFGAFVQKVYVEGLDAVETPSYTINSESETHVDPYGVTRTHIVTSKVFGGATTWSYEFKIVQHQIKKAFLSNSEMMAFVDAQFQAAYTSMEIEKDVVVNSAINTGIALCVYNGLCKNLLGEYNAFFNKELTQADCMYDADFLKWANKEWNKTLRLMGNPSKRYNASSYLNALKREDMILEIFADWSENSKVFLESGTYHDDKVKIAGNYSDIDFWQINSPDPSVAMAINIENKDVAYDEVGEQNIPIQAGGIIGFARDKEFVKALFEENYSWSLPNPRERSSVYGYDFERGFAIEPHANAMVFCATDVHAEGDEGIASVKLSGYAMGETVTIDATPGNGKAIKDVKYTVDDGTPVTVSAVEGVYRFTIPPHLESVIVNVTSKNA